MECKFYNLLNNNYRSALYFYSKSLEKLFADNVVSYPKCTTDECLAVNRLRFYNPIKKWPFVSSFLWIGIFIRRIFHRRTTTTTRGNGPRRGDLIKNSRAVAIRDFDLDVTEPARHLTGDDLLKFIAPGNQRRCVRLSNRCGIFILDAQWLVFPSILFLCNFFFVIYVRSQRCRSSASRFYSVFSVWAFTHVNNNSFFMTSFVARLREYIGFSALSVRAVRKNLVFRKICRKS